MRQKLKNSQGETLVEVLASILISSLSVLLLFGAVGASSSIDLTAQTADEQYYKDLSKAERQSDEGDGSGESDKYTAVPVGVAVKVTKKEETTSETPEEPGVTVTFYGGNGLLSYKYTGSAASPPGSDSGEGDGG